MGTPSAGEFRGLLPYLKPYTGRYILGFVCLLVVDGAQILVPQCIKRAVDTLAAGDFALGRMYALALEVLALAAVISAGRFLWRYFIHGSSRRIEAQVRQDYFKRLLSLSYDFYQRNKIGDLMARATNDLGAVRMSIGMGFVAMIDGTAMAITILVIMFVQDPATAFFAVLPLPVISILMIIFGKAVGRLFRRVQETYSALSDIAQETFAGIRVVKSFAKEWWFIRKFADGNRDYQAANMSLVKAFGLAFPLVMFLSGMTTLILVLVGGAKVMRGTMSIGQFAAFFSYLHMLVWPIMSLGFMINMMQRGAASMARINEILNTEPSIVQVTAGADSPAPAPDSGAAVSIRHLTFTYPGEGGKEVPPALADVSLDIPRGAFVGILGKTGSGKSTLLKTLPRLVDPPAGTVFVNGRDVREYPLDELRSLFAAAPQDTYLFSDTIRANAAYGADSPTDGAIREALDAAALTRDLEEFPLGWDTVIGERGVTLSGGQKQRAAIARALMRQGAEILLLDDALSAVDADTERTFLTRFLEERRGRTTVLVSHRVSTLQHTDFVAVLDGGRIIERGTPRELMDLGGFFARTAQLQRLEAG
ncbi:MAG: ABC transporter ATP-binding protein/permease [Spirochaetaceae bacterium]|jgi:ATP-binding cassette subfamily B protein|nr:ABC transporter ATP-binding protein/permease [Spirochaetaceae bacterium]